MNIIAEGTGLVEILHFEWLYHYPSDAFDKFIDRNKSTLRSVTISCDDDFLISQSDVGKMTGKFLQCPLLDDISFKELPGEDELKALRRRGVLFHLKS